MNTFILSGELFGCGFKDRFTHGSKSRDHENLRAGSRMASSPKFQFTWGQSVQSRALRAWKLGLTNTWGPQSLVLNPEYKTGTHIFTNSLNNIYLINNHIQQPTSQHHHLDKLLIAAIIHQIYWTSHLIHIHKVRAHTWIVGNKKANTLTNEGTLQEKPTATPHIHLAHTTP